MKNLGKTIDKLLKVDPTLEEKLLPIKAKWKKYPGRSINYWKELITYLNTDPSILNHPKRPEISDIFTPKKRPTRQQLNSFEMVSPTDRVLGIIPENLADEVRHHDHQAIEIAKVHVEANITKSPDLMAQVNRKEAILEINNKKIWLRLKDHFQLWDRSANVTIKKQENGLLALTEYPNIPRRPSPGIMRIDPNTFGQFLQSLGLEPPPED
jgi:hypothetical protein